MPSKKNNKNMKNQKGGKIVMPSEYYGNDSGKYFPEGDPNLNIGDSAYGTNFATSRGISIGNDMTGPDLGPTNHGGLQTGGRVVHSAEYYGNDSGKYYADGDPNLIIGDSAYGQNLATSRGISIGNNMTGPDLGPTNHSGLQTGGYSVIKNPVNGGFVNLKSKKGKNILKQYLRYLIQSGGYQDPFDTLVNTVQNYMGGTNTTTMEPTTTDDVPTTTAEAEYD